MAKKGWTLSFHEEPHEDEVLQGASCTGRDFISIRKTFFLFTVRTIEDCGNLARDVAESPSLDFQDLSEQGAGSCHLGSLSH